MDQIAKKNPQYLKHKQAGRADQWGRTNWIQAKHGLKQGDPLFSSFYSCDRYVESDIKISSQK